MQKTKKIYIGADHAGFDLKEKIKAWLDTEKIAYDDCGNTAYNSDDDYPDFAEKVARKVVKNNGLGLLACGSAEGICIAANKVRGVRAVNPHDLAQVKVSREHNDANILCLAGGGMLKPQPGISFSKAKKMIRAFLNTPFSGAERHQRRIQKIALLEKKQG
ncbi:RpiB/LacA/LacB family sugar-phosphate isomerase [Candidatus Woesearchaeota archaeon]|nr:RpiB/LacA/LacB family sugar-phosphate isomerase [Candidatus Woesearchaeota archaeon]